MNTAIILIRHTESLKNLRDIHGGNGEALTERGRCQADILCSKLKKIGAYGSSATIMYAENIQVRETAKIISQNLAIPTRVIPDFKPLYLGIAHGLSNAEVSAQYPKVYLLLQQWRRKEIEICDLKIPEMEDPKEFYIRGINILQKLDPGKYNILVATNSLYILLLNILLGNSCKKGGGYRHFDIPNGGMSLFRSSSGGKFFLDPSHTDVHDVLSYRS